MSELKPVSYIEKRLKNLETHLEEENRDNPALLEAVKTFRELDKIAYRLGILDQEQSYATRVSWWPMVAVLGTFSAGKSTFINSYLGHALQRTGNQAVDDKFTVICYSSAQEGVKTLPGVALDADPRFPFYQISKHIMELSHSGAERVNTYLQLKTCPSEVLRGRIVIDSPGFDADEQRKVILRLTEHITDLADLVLVFFDARHPEPGAMQDTLNHLVKRTIDRPDSNKFLYILNQIDVTSKEDNPEEVVAAWQRALAQSGLTAGRFYRIYNPEAAVPMLNPKVKERFEAKREADMGEINLRMQQVEVERAYRVIGVLQQTAQDIEHKTVPQIMQLIERWRTGVLRWEAAALISLLLLGGVFLSATGLWDIFSGILDNPVLLGGTALVAVGVLGFIHFGLRGWVANRVVAKLAGEIPDEFNRESLTRAFRKNTAWWRPLFRNSPAGWNHHTRQAVATVVAEANEYVQKLNDRFTNPSGRAKEGAE
jgi:GTPase Era involved in 16S rRNA processing